MTQSKQLNDRQLEAVKSVDGPVLILAGAGSGKTTVLVNRIAYMIDVCGISPYAILAITFTNKAAGEMQERIRAQVGEIADGMWIGTFHSMCARMLRSCIENIGYDRNFIIYDTVDSKAVLRECYKELNVSEKNFPMRATQTVISRSKDNMILPEMFERVYKNDFRMLSIGRIYSLYQEKLKRYNALDFDDIILCTIKVLSEYPEVLESWQRRFRYVMVDEYQDTNNAQYMLISLLSGSSRNLCVVGDDDQSIYKFRGANINNILNFEDEFPEALVIRLEQNYRSTKNILGAANAVISNNKGRKGKELWTDFEDGEKLFVFNAANEHEEGEYIAAQVKKLVESSMKYSDCAVLYRMNAQSRVLEEMFMRAGIPYRVLAGLRFYDRKEIKDVTAYLRVLHNSGDSVSLARIINVPKRAIGQTTVDKAALISADEGLSLFEVISRAEAFPELARAAKKLTAFAALITELAEQKNKMPLSEYIKYVVEKTGYMEMCRSDEDKSEIARAENIEELISVAAEFEADPLSEGTLDEFLEKIALVSDADNYDADADSVVMMTIHSAKGLEFPAVFLPGFENGIFPGIQSMMQEEDMEEERRLCYVAITRAKKRLFITHADSRMIYGKTTYQHKSQFLTEIPEEYIEPCEREKPVFGRGAGAAFGRSVADFLGGAVQKQKTYRAFKERDDAFVNSARQKEAGGAFSGGERVRHKKFGDGTILQANPFGSDFKLIIQFDSGQIKTLMAEYAHLERI